MNFDESFRAEMRATEDKARMILEERWYDIPHMLDGTQGLVTDGDMDQAVGMSLKCYKCRDFIYPRHHNILKGLQWTCGHATWGPVDLRTLRLWLAFMESQAIPFVVLVRFVYEEA